MDGARRRGVGGAGPLSLRSSSYLRLGWDEMDLMRSLIFIFSRHNAWHYDLR